MFKDLTRAHSKDLHRVINAREAGKADARKALDRKEREDQAAKKLLNSLNRDQKKLFLEFLLIWSD